MYPLCLSSPALCDMRTGMSLTGKNGSAQRTTATGASGVGGSVLAAAVTAVRPRRMAIVLIIFVVFLSIRFLSVAFKRGHSTLFSRYVKRKVSKKLQKNKKTKNYKHILWV